MALDAQTVLKRNSLFLGLSAPTIDRISKLATRRTYNSGDIVFSQGERSDALFGVITGKVRISISSQSGREIFLNVMEPGDTFGEISLLDGQPRTASATIIARSELIAITHKDFMLFLRQEPTLLNHVFILLCQRVRWTSGMVEDWALLDAPARLAQRLVSLCKMHGHEEGERMVLKISQEELGQFLGLSRQVINQYLQTWSANGWVALGRNKITVIDEISLRSATKGHTSSHP